MVFILALLIVLVSLILLLQGALMGPPLGIVYSAYGF
jgi:hypothetical protein